MEWTCLDRWIFLQAGFFHKISIFRGTGRKGKNMSECVREMEVAPLTLEQFEVLNKKNYMLEEENRKLKSDVRELQQVIINMCHERYSSLPTPIKI